MASSFPAAPRRALLVIDVQNDFLPGGTLAVPKGDLILPAVNALMTQDFDAIIASRDWHPQNHISFVPQGGDWPIHCVAGTGGADFSPHLHQNRLSHIVHKGLDPACDSYSAFFDNDQRHSTGLDALLRGLGITHVTLCGLALDFCVAATARDARKLGFETVISLAACKGIAEDPAACLNALEALGVKIDRA
ncbi:nicotinamidase [Asaia spathodeae]|uniref:nicotinamidase n=1 Tax=Asaia spathodeae TaxID=657016 RepID=A0ABX2P4D8_9PROT|nr:nicotinamidase [Asaia spathodeae]GBR11707.1 nicotinamidase [Asaia spathodeae NBRC 105894]